MANRKLDESIDKHWNIYSSYIISYFDHFLMIFTENSDYNAHRVFSACQHKQFCTIKVMFGCLPSIYYNGDRKRRYLVCPLASQQNTHAKSHI